MQQKKANFDATHELEELLLEENPLKARKRKEQDINSLSAEMRQMEEQFTPYDFKNMQRRSYYPHNQQIMTTMTATSSMGLTPSRPETPADGISVGGGRKTDDFSPMQAVPLGRVGGTSPGYQ